jgi:hypothetical protein
MLKSVAFYESCLFSSFYFGFWVCGRERIVVGYLIFSWVFSGSNGCVLIKMKSSLALWPGKKQRKRRKNPFCFGWMAVLGGRFERLQTKKQSILL